ncbi:MAG: YbaN family protein [Marinibacterium sp.]|nr:YbaN family protein [Marinibacterium sp.]
MAHLARPLWLLAGGLALVLGALGVVLPVLPTTPFVLLAAFCFARSSPRIAAYLEEHRIFGPMIEDWRRTGAIAPRYKRIAVGMMGAALGLSLVMGVPVRVLIIQVVAIALAATYVLSRPSH